MSPWGPFERITLQIAKEYLEKKSPLISYLPNALTVKKSAHDEDSIFRGSHSWPLTARTGIMFSMWVTAFTVPYKYSLPVSLTVLMCFRLCLFLSFSIHPECVCVFTLVNDISPTSQISFVINSFLDEYYHSLQKRKLSTKIQWPI